MIDIKVPKAVKILAFAKTRKEGIATLEALEETLKHHLFKVILFPKSMEIKHYISEIQSYVRRFQQIVLKKGFLNKELIYNILYDNYSNNMENQLISYANDLKKDGYPINNQILSANYSAKLEKLKEFYLKLAEMLEDGYKGSTKDIIVENLLNEYNLL